MNDYIEGCLKGARNVTVILLNGFQMKGRIVSAFPDYIIFKCDGMEKLIFKHAISTVQPA